MSNVLLLACLKITLILAFDWPFVKVQESGISVLQNLVDVFSFLLVSSIAIEMFGAIWIHFACYLFKKKKKPLWKVLRFSPLFTAFWNFTVACLGQVLYSFCWHLMCCMDVELTLFSSRRFWFPHIFRFSHFRKSYFFYYFIIVFFWEISLTFPPSLLLKFPFLSHYFQGLILILFLFKK